MNYPKTVLVGCYNVQFYLTLKDNTDESKFQYFVERINRGEVQLMKDITEWCCGQGILCKSKFIYRKDFPLRANLWNLYTYLRFKFEKTIKARQKTG